MEAVDEEARSWSTLETVVVVVDKSVHLKVSSAISPLVVVVVVVMAADFLLPLPFISPKFLRSFFVTDRPRLPRPLTSELEDDLEEDDDEDVEAWEPKEGGMEEAAKV